MVQWLWHERGVLVSKSTVCRLIKNRNWTRKKLKRISLNRSEALRRAYLDDIRQFTAEDLVFVDERRELHRLAGAPYGARGLATSRTTRDT